MPSFICKFFFEGVELIMWNELGRLRDRRDQKFRFDTDTFSGSRSIPRLILILKVGLNRDRYWYWYQENVPGLILIPRLYLIRILPKPYKKCTSLWIDTGTDTETQKQPRSRLILILKALVSAFSIRYRYSRLSLLWRDHEAGSNAALHTHRLGTSCHFLSQPLNIKKYLPGFFYLLKVK